MASINLDVEITDLENTDLDKMRDQVYSALENKLGNLNFTVQEADRNPDDEEE